MTEPISAGLLDVTRRISEIRALLDIDGGTPEPAAAAVGGEDFASALLGALDAGAPVPGLPATPAPVLPDASAVPPGYALVPLSALGLGTQASLTGSLGAVASVAGDPVPSAAAVPVPPSAVPPPSPQAALRVALAAAEIGVAESSPGSNDGPRIAEYRTATAGAGVGPWCAYFTSWIGRQAGTPLAADGQGEGYVPSMAAWLRAEGRYVTPTEATPRPGDLVFFDWQRDGELDHIGIVQSVGADGRVHTIEGNSSDAVRQRSYSPDQIAGYGLLP